MSAKTEKQPLNLTLEQKKSALAFTELELSKAKEMLDNVHKINWRRVLKDRVDVLEAQAKLIREDIAKPTLTIV